MAENQRAWPMPRSPFQHPRARRPLSGSDHSGTGASTRDDHEFAAHVARRRQELQWRVVERLHEMNLRHGDVAWERRYRRPLSPYGIAFVFGLKGVVSAATKLWLAGPEPDDPADLLGALVEVARSRDQRKPWDVREQIANRAVGVADDATYLGLGMSLLDTGTGTWTQVCATASSALQIPGTMLFVAGAPDGPDGQRAFVADRRGAAGHNKVSIWSHRALSTPALLSRWPYAQVSLDTLYREHGVGQLLGWMTALDHEVRAAEAGRRGFS
ncbi:hypothetical protein [Actinoplanes sp. NPDC023714]|uniref:hypothetical protein n=1 Tax=Actinoplanes sp. NPDC023714 TaxID=3154322 RepID=UPI00340234EE